MAKLGIGGIKRRLQKLMAETSKYRAPALDKGLDILELLSRSATPLLTKEIAERLDYSKNEIFRMLQVLESRDYISRSDGEAGYVLTNRLFRMGMERPRNKELVEAALPIMHRLADEVSLACHLAVASQDQMVVITRIDAPSDLGVVVRVGHRRPIAHSTSGLVLFAFQSDDVRSRWMELLDRTDEGYKRAELLKRADLAVSQGYAKLPSISVDGVIDLSAPILENGHAVGALAIPFIERHPARKSLKATIEALCKAAEEISNNLQ